MMRAHAQLQVSSVGTTRSGATARASSISFHHLSVGVPGARSQYLHLGGGVVSPASTSPAGRVTVSSLAWSPINGGRRSLSSTGGGRLDQELFSRRKNALLNFGGHRSF